MRLRVRTVRIDLAEPLGRARPGGAGPRLMMVRGGQGLVASGVATRIEVGIGSGRAAAAAEVLAQLDAMAETEDEVRRPGTGLVAIGSLTFDPQESGSVLIVPSVVVGRHGDTAWRTEIVPMAAGAGDGAMAPPNRDEAGRTHHEGKQIDRPRFSGSSVRDEDWLVRVDGALRRIAEGELEKVVLARDQLLWSRTPFDEERLLALLVSRFPDCHVFAVEGLVGASPELLLRRDDYQVASRVLAGTVARGRSEDEDDQLAAELLGSDKERREHELAVRSVDSALTALGAALEIPEAPRVLRMRDVQHLATDVTGRLEPTLSSLAMLDFLHPTAAVGGSPRDAALHAIRELEGMSRGRYAGPVGWCDGRGDGEWAIALRCAQLDGPRARLFAGAGVVAASLPERELIETTLKLRAMRDALELLLLPEPEVGSA